MKSTTVERNLSGAALTLVLAIGISACSPTAAGLAPSAPIPGAAVHSVARASGSGSLWDLVSSPNDPLDSAGLYDDQLNGVSGSSASDVWAVGRYCCTPNGTQEYYSSLLEHWNGSSWKLVPGSSSEPQDVQLFAVASVSPTDAWAVGQSTYPNSQALIEHWNGKAWSIVSAGGSYNKSQLLTITVIAPNDIWAAGDADFGPLLEHWDGTQWTATAPPGREGESTLINGIAAASSNDIMAVGSYSSPNTHIFALHWNGSTWSDVSPTKKFYSSRFLGITSNAAGSYWAVGFEDPNKRSIVPQTLAEHWTGTKFVRVPSPNDEPASGPPLTNVLTSVVAQSSSDIWAVGLWTYFPGAGTPRSLFERWNGKKWAIEAGPPPLESNNNSATNELLNITKVGSKQLWAVGNQDIPPYCCEQTLTVSTTHG